MDSYFVLCQSEDSFSISMPLSEKEVLKRIEEGYYGTYPILDRMPERAEYGFQNVGILIIKGSIVVPKAKEVVTKFEF